MKHIRVSNLSCLTRLQGSKYVQSEVGKIFLLVEQDIRAGRMILFSATSCVIDGLNRYLRLKKLDQSKVYTCDLVCHGVVSPLMYRENLKRIEGVSHKKVRAVNFRNKKFGWNSHVETYTLEDGTALDERYYAELFYSHVALRECCYNCRYLDLSEKPADITMADFWGIEKILPDWKDDNKGISLAAVRSKKGLELLKIANLKICEVQTESVLNDNRKDAIKKPKIHEIFWQDFFQKGYEYCLKKYTIYGGVPFKVKRKILKYLHKW